MSKTETQLIIEHYVPDDSNLESNITELLNKLKIHDLLNDDIDIVLEKKIIIEGLTNLPVYEKNTMEKIWYQIYRLLLGTFKNDNLIYVHNSEQTGEYDVAQLQHASNLEETEAQISRPRSESISAPNIGSINYKSKNQRVNVITIQTSLDEIQERTHRNHDLYKSRNHQIEYSSSNQTACTNWQMRSLGITNDESLQTMIDNKKKTGNACLYTASLNVMKSYAKCPHIKIIKVNLIDFAGFLWRSEANNFALPIEIRHKHIDASEPGHSIILVKEKVNEKGDMVLYDPSASKILWKRTESTPISDICRLPLNIQEEVSIYVVDEDVCISLIDKEKVGLRFGGLNKKSRKGHKTKCRRRKTKKRRKRSNRRR